ncbi:hypothetical protein [Novosphingobium sp.]|uniref:hypothetical protein n=1 Tax=Novosphingobium sp. TaxID=1874826 RepID=UPI0027348E4A|nr:hypothetical protein [Novosphingobium sp.]MDP3906903.1 hypothetical protein [Novosphingobium sp.]
MRRTLLICTAALGLAAPALAQEIVVTGKPLSQTEAELKDCIKRQCSPDQDVAASLAHAENLFVAGNYKDSRTTLKASLGRNRQHGKAYPVPVSDLLRANSRIAEHVGEAKDFQLSVLEMRDTLKKGVGADDFRTLVAQIEVGDSRAKLGFAKDAERIYGEVEKKALKLGQNRVASFARLRKALLTQVAYDAEPTNAYLRERLGRELGQLIDQPLPGGDEFALAAEVLRAKADRKAGDTASTDALIRRFAQRGGVTRPVLLFAEPLERALSDQDFPGTMSGLNTLNQITAIQNRGQWADIGFWISADGKVSDVDVLRKSGEQSWLKPVTRNIAKRIYAPLKQNGDSAPGFYMVERYTQTARIAEDQTGTRIRRREATPRIEVMDLTPDNYEAPKTED